MSEKDQNKIISKEFISMELENEESKKETSKDNILSGLSEIAQSNQASTKAQSSLSSISQIEPKEEPEEEDKKEEKVSIIHLEENQISSQINNDESNNSSKPLELDPQYQNDIDECLNGKKDPLAQIQISMDEESEENYLNENNKEYFGDVFDLNPLENNHYDNRNLIPIQPWEKPGIPNKSEPPSKDDEILNEEDFNFDINKPQPHILFEEEEPLPTINYDEIPFDGGNYCINATNYATEYDQG